MAIVRGSDGCLVVTAKPMHTPTADEAWVARLQNTFTYWFWNGADWIEIVIGDDTVYGGVWNGSGNVPTQNQLYAVIEDLKSQIQGVGVDDGVYKYSAEIEQIGTGHPAPIAFVKNSVGAVTWNRDGTGEYYGVLAGAFAGPTTVLVGTKKSEVRIWAAVVDDDTVHVWARDEGGSSADVDGNFYIVIETVEPES